MNHDRLTVAWLKRSGMFSLPGAAIVKLRLGEAPEHIPTTLDVRGGHCPLCNHTHVGDVDHVLSHFADDFHIARLHGSARCGNMPSQRHLHFDDTEHVVGVARTFKIHCNHDCAVGDLVDALQQLSVVEHAYPDYLTVTPFLEETEIDPQDLANAWKSRARVRAAEALAHEPGDPAFTVAVVDTGVTAGHPELLGRLRSGLDTVQLADETVAPGIKLVGDNSRVDNEPDDNVGHGTSCVGIISALGNQIPPGLAGRCGMLPVRVLGSAQFPGQESVVGIGAISNIDEGMKRTMDLGAKVINMSFGTPMDLLDEDGAIPHEDIVAYGLERNCILIAASGNSGREERYTPAALDGVIAVGATGEDGRPAHFSTRGDHVSLCAPGERVISTGLGDAYMRVTGTSFAAPFVSAAAALLVSRAARRSVALNADEVREILEASVAPWIDPTSAEGHGKGVLDAQRALSVLDERLNQQERQAA